FSHAVAVSGTVLVVGAPGEGTNGFRSGSAYVYQINTNPAPGTLAASLDGSGNLVVTDIDSIGKNNSLTLRNDGLGHLVVSDASEQFNGTGGIPGAVLSGGNKTLTVPLASITGPMITFDGMGGNDTLTAVLTSALGKTLTFNGGDPTSTPGDKLVLSGGSATS